MEPSHEIDDNAAVEQNDHICLHGEAGRKPATGD
jgi:hypothetical protein